MIRAYTHVGFGGTVAVSLVRHPEVESYPREPHILRIGQTGDGIQTHTWEAFDPHTVGPEPTFRIGMEEALALSEALSELQHGTSELRALRGDYDAERKRVDRLIDTLSAVATDASR